MKDPAYGLPSVNQLVEISLSYSAGCDRLLIATVAQHLDMIGGSEYCLIVELVTNMPGPAKGPDLTLINSQLTRCAVFRVDASALGKGNLNLIEVP